MIETVLCPFCNKHPFSYIDLGVGVPKPVAVTCCEQAGLIMYNTLIGLKPVEACTELTNLSLPDKLN